MNKIRLTLHIDLVALSFVGLFSSYYCIIDDKKAGDDL